MNIVVTGPSGHGKTTFGKALAKHLNSKALNTSDWLTRVEKHRWCEEHRLRGTDPAIVNEMRRRASMWNVERDRPHRIMLRALGDALAAEDPVILIRHVIQQGARVVIGIRRAEELRAAIEADLIHYNIWIERAGVPDEPDNLTVTREMADLVLEDMRLADLEKTAEDLATRFKKSLSNQG